MTVNVSASGFYLNLIASLTFPAGITLTTLADDVDPIDIPSIPIGDTGRTVNGAMVYWKTPTNTKVVLAVLPGTLEDQLLNILFQANKAKKFSINLTDIITLTTYYPDLSFTTFIDGRITAGSPSSGIATTARKKTKTYEFTFEDEVNT
jgi:hypothetical protein